MDKRNQTIIRFEYSSSKNGAGDLIVFSHLVSGISPLEKLFGIKPKNPI